MHSTTSPTAARLGPHRARRDRPRSAVLDTAERLANVRGLLDKIEQLRHMSHELRPTILDDLGLKPALEFLADGVWRRTGLKVVVDGSPGGRLPTPIETALYRIVQEALTNVTKHARATRVSIVLERSGPFLRCAIHDDGAGFDVAAVLARRGSCGARPDRNPGTAARDQRNARHRRETARRHPSRHLSAAGGGPCRLGFYSLMTTRSLGRAWKALLERRASPSSRKPATASRRSGKRAQCPDVAVLDFSAAAERARRGPILDTCPRAKAILLTMHTDDHYVLEAVRAGVKGYVVKTQASVTWCARSTRCCAA